MLTPEPSIVILLVPTFRTIWMPAEIVMLWSTVMSWLPAMSTFCEPFCTSR